MSTEYIVNTLYSTVGAEYIVSYIYTVVYVEAVDLYPISQVTLLRGDICDSCISKFLSLQ